MTKKIDINNIGYVSRRVSEYNQLYSTNVAIMDHIQVDRKFQKEYSIKHHVCSYGFEVRISGSVYTAGFDHLPEDKMDIIKDCILKQLIEYEQDMVSELYSYGIDVMDIKK